MSDPNSNEFWQVEVNGQVYEADFAELAQWIAEGSLQPEDKVRRGNLRWIEARKVPTLIAFFNAKAHGVPPPPVISTTVAESPEPSLSTFQATADVSQPGQVTVEPAVVSVTHEARPIQPALIVSSPANPNLCVNHQDRPSKFLCQSCSLNFCKECVKSFGSSVLVCSVCGGMCKPKTQVETEQKTAEFRSAAIDKGFGFGDFGEAIAYPFKFKTSLFFGAIMFMFFSLGKLASAIGGIYMITAAIFSFMLANMLTFGILANTVESFAHGKIGNNFMPSFDDFELWDDVIHPFFLWIGATLSSFGPFFAVLALGSYFVFSSLSAQADNYKSTLAETPGTPYYGNVPDTFKQSEQVKGVLSNSAKINQQRLDQQQQIENGEEPTPPAVNQEEEDFQRVNNMIADSKRKELEAVVGKSAETRAKESEQFFNGLLRLAAPLVVLGFITFLWGVFYYPAASTVAAYTRSFAAAINPLIGLDTIKRLGFDYVKILFMGLLLVIAFLVVGTVVAMVFSPFDMPGFGNLPAKAVGSIFEFYLWIVFACILGFAMFKASDRLKLYR